MAKVVEITPPDIRVVQFKIIGSAPYVQNKFSQKAREEIRIKQEQKERRRGDKKEPKNFQKAYEQAMHVSDDGWHGIPASAFRAAMVSACRLVGFTMTQAKLAVFIYPDGFDRDDRTPLVRIIKGDPFVHEAHVRIAQGTTTVIWRPMWREGWEALVKVQYDAGMFSQSDIANLLTRVGMQVGIGEGRPDSKSSTGMGWGTFIIDSDYGVVEL
jgi:hypothetical protein